MRVTRVLVAGAVAVMAAGAGVRGQGAQPPSGYQLPPKVIVDMLDAPPAPTIDASPSRDVIAVLERASMPTIADLAAPMHRLAGLRINPRTNGPHRTTTYHTITLRTVDGDQERTVTLPAGTRKLAWLGFSPDGRRFAFTQAGATGTELWVGDSATGRAEARTGPALNAVFGAPCRWVGQGASLLCRMVPEGRGAEPARPEVPSGPNIQENRGKAAPVRTYQDLLESRDDEAIFAHYATSQLVVVDAATGQRANVGAPGIHTVSEVSPNGEFLLVERVKRPFSWLVPYDDFPKDVQVWDRKGAVVKTLADLPVADTVPNNGVLPGPRAYRWVPTQPATVAWVEALDGGDPKATVPHRDKVVTLAAPFTAAPSEIAKLQWRYRSADWTEGGTALVTEFDRQTRLTRTWAVDAAGAAPRKLWERSSEDAYADPGTFVRELTNSGHRVVTEVNGSVYLTGEGSSAEGDRPFLDRMDLKTQQKTRVYQTAARTYEPVLALLADDASRLLTRRETSTQPPNVFARDPEGATRKALTGYPNPAPGLEGVKSEMVTYPRKDGVQLRATILTPPGWTPDKGPLPALLWAYPREFTDPRTAGQVTGSPHRFPSPGWSTLHKLFLTQGYAIIDDPTMPIVGPGETANDNYVEQLVASAQAAVDKAVAMGVVDRDRVIAGGHSYGAFMTANLLAHSDIFRAGIARSGAYNRTLTPFGFQNEQRTFWEVPQIYARMSPFNHADKIKEPILLMHGEADDNTGTFPIQSERFYMALKGHGATVRYVTLPHEAHGYQARESVLHTVAEMLNWANEWARDAKPRATTSQQPR